MRHLVLVLTFALFGGSVFASGPNFTDKYVCYIGTTMANAIQIENSPSDASRGLAILDNYHVEILQDGESLSVWVIGKKDNKSLQSLRGLILSKDEYIDLDFTAYETNLTVSCHLKN